MPPDFKLIYKSVVNQKSMILAQKQTCRPMEQNRELRSEPIHLGQLTFDKEARPYYRVRTVFSINGIGETRQPHAKE